jgi:hypothetical protein
MRHFMLTAALLAATAPAAFAANLVTDGSFETGTVDNYTTPPGFELRDGTYGRYVDSGGVTDGLLAFQLIGTFQDAGAYGGLFYNKTGAELGLVVGQTYLYGGSLTLNTTGQVQNAYLRFESPLYAGNAHVGIVAANGSSTTVFLDGQFVYTGGDIGFLGQIDAYSGVPTEVRATFDNLYLRPIPEPAAMGLIATLLPLALRRHRA